MPKEARVWAFYRYLPVDFESILVSDPRHLQMKEARGFDNMTGDNINIAETPEYGFDWRLRQIQYGSKKAISYSEIGFSRDLSPRITHSASIERGATLVFNCSDEFTVYVLLYLPKTRNMESVDSAYALKPFVAGRNMTSRAALERVAREFRAVAECASIDGQPLPADRFRVLLLRWFRPRISDGKTLPPRSSGFWIEVLKLTLTVGFSGFLLWLIDQL